MNRKGEKNQQENQQKITVVVKFNKQQKVKENSFVSKCKLAH